jgi:aminoglycoside phosphotransferase (APT) family kinase protein
MEDTPPAEMAFDAGLVRRLLGTQMPHLADLPLRRVNAGWDNEIWRLGDELAVRLPRRAMGAPLVVHEQTWLPVLAPVLPLPVPVPLRIGGPSTEYPWAWHVHRWIEGEGAMDAPLGDSQMAETLGRFLAALHRPAPPEAPHNPWRGVPLADRTEATLQRAATVRDLVDERAVASLWSELVETEPWAGPPLWVHGDLHPGNLVRAGDQLVGVIDFGDLTAGDPATDLAVAWMLFAPADRPVLRDAAGADDATRRRARAWALALALAYLASSGDSPALRRLGLRTVAAALTAAD